MRDLFRQQWRKFKVFIHSKDALVYLLFVLLATLIWLANALSTRRTITLTIPVTYTHIPEDCIFTTAPSDHVHVTLEDEGVDLFRNRSRKYELSFDLSEYFEGEEGSFIIPMDVLRQAIAQQLAGDATLAAFAPELLSGSYSRQHEKTVPIVYTGQIKPASQHQLCGEVTLSPRYAKIYGTEQVLSGINHVETSLTDYEGVQDTFATRLALIAPQGVRVKPDSIELQAVAELFTEKAIQLTINTPDLTDKGQTLHLFPSHVTVTFRVGATWFNRVGEGDIEASVDMPQPDIDHLPVHIASHNPHITHIRIKPEEVEYLIENYETHSDGGPAATVSED